MIGLLVFIGFCALAYWVCVQLSMPQPFLNIVLVILVVACVIASLTAFGLASGLPSLR